MNMSWIIGVASSLSVAAVAFLFRGGTTSAGGDESQIYAEVDEFELEAMRLELTPVGRFLHMAVEFFADDIQELIYVGQILRENRGLLILLVGGVCSMMMALVAGLENVDILKALGLSTALYGITTVLVAKSARRLVLSSTQQGKAKLTMTDVRKMMDAVPKEEFCDLDTCDESLIKKMLSNRGVVQIECTSNREDLIKQLHRATRRSTSCCICMSNFLRGESIRVLPRCHHEFHTSCIDQWACTFVSGSCKRLDAKHGKPTCPLCCTCVTTE
jgi:hypothetical protein